MLMKHEIHGLTDVSGGDVETLKKAGWIEYSYEQHAQDVAKKQQKVDNVEQPQGDEDGNTATPSGVEAPRRRGRKPKGE